jgi:D-alanyl-D-alanine carboxypeptidase
MQLGKVIPATCLSALMLGCTTGSTLAQTSTLSTPETSGLEACVSKVMDQTGFSGVIAIGRPGQTLTLGRGVMGPTGSQAIAGETQFNVASTGKMFTAVAIAQLVDAGKLQLDDPVGRHLSGLTPEASAVTVRQLLTHSGGMGNFFTPDTLALIGRAQSLSDLKPLIADVKPEFEPGSRFDYSNSGFLILGLIVEQVSGETYGAYLDRHIFQPAGMRASTLVPGPTTRRALGMTSEPEMPPSGQAGPPGANPLRPAAEAAIHGHSAGGGYSTAGDLHRFLTAMTAGELTSAAMRDMLLAPQIEEFPATATRAATHYGLGFSIRSTGTHRWVGHPGGTFGVHVEARAYLDDQTTVVVMANRDPPTGAGDLLRAVLPVLLDGATCPA